MLDARLKNGASVGISFRARLGDERDEGVATTGEVMFIVVLIEHEYTSKNMRDSEGAANASGAVINWRVVGLWRGALHRRWSATSNNP